ncbi:hypothetical protein D3C74_264540 [compost metagenome]
MDIRTLGGREIHAGMFLLHAGNRVDPRTISGRNSCAVHRQTKRTAVAFESARTVRTLFIFINLSRLQLVLLLLQSGPFRCQFNEERFLLFANVFGLFNVGVVFRDQLLLLVLFRFQIALAGFGIRVKLLHFCIVLLQLLLLLHDQFLVPFVLIQKYMVLVGYRLQGVCPFQKISKASGGQQHVQIGNDAIRIHQPDTGIEQMRAFLDPGLGLVQFFRGRPQVLLGLINV